MSRKESRKSGTLIVRCTRYTLNDKHDSGWATEASPIWLHKAYRGDSPYYEIEGEEYLCGGNIPEEDLKYPGLLSITNSDTYEIVPEDQVPDEIWGEIARQALVGDK